MVKKTFAAAAAMVAGLAYVTPAQAALSPLDDFEGHALGGINGKGSWIATTNTYSATPSVVDLDGNQVLVMPSAFTGGTTASGMTAANTGFTVNDGDTATMFYQFKFDVPYNTAHGADIGPISTPPAQTHYTNGNTGNRVAMGFSSSNSGFGSADFAKLANWSQLGLYYSTNNVTYGDHLQNDFTIQIGNPPPATWDDVEFYDLDLDAQVWYNLWQVIDTDARTFSMYIQAADPTDDPDYAAQTLFAANVPLHNNHRNATTLALQSFMLVNGNNADQPVYFDNFHIDTTSATLANPVPEPASLGLLAMGGLMLVRRRRA